MSRHEWLDLRMNIEEFTDTYEPTDPKATVAWTTADSPSIGTNKKLEIGQTSGEAIQMDFGGQDGFVLVQLYEEHGGA